MTINYSISEWISYVVLIITFVFGIASNLFILDVIHRKQLTTTTYKLIENQVFSDALFSIIAISRSLFCAHFMVSSGIFFKICCSATTLVKLSTIHVSVLSMILISYERYRKLYKPFSNEIKINLWIFVIWLTALLLALLQIVQKPSEIFFGKKYLFNCEIIFPLDSDSFIIRYGLIIYFIFILIIPVMTTSYFYYKVIKKLRQINLTKKRIQANNIENFEHQKRNTIKMLLSIVIWYFLISTPLNLYIFVQKYIFKFDLLSYCDPNKQIPIRLFILMGIYVFGCICVNPFIICYYNSDFRDEAILFLKINKININVRKNDTQISDTSTLP